MFSRLIDINQLAAWPHIAKGTLYNWVYQRRIPFVKLGRSLRFDPEQIEQIIKKTPANQLPAMRERPLLLDMQCQDGEWEFEPSVPVTKEPRRE